MTIQLSPALTQAASPYAPLLALLRDTLIRPRELAERWKFGEDHLSNLRRRALGPSFIRLPTATGKAARPLGSIRYRLSDIIGCELAGTGGAISLARVELAIAGCEMLTAQQRAAVIARMKTVL